MSVDDAGPLVRSRGWTRIVRHAPSGRIQIGGRVQLERGVTLIVHDGACIQLGDRVYVNEGVRIESLTSVEVGAGCLLGNDVVIVDSDLHVLDGRLDARPVVLEDHVWVGLRSIILPGVRVGRGAVVGAGSVVTRDVAAGSLVAGNPARVLREQVTWSARRPEASRSAEASGP